MRLSQLVCRRARVDAPQSRKAKKGARVVVDGHSYIAEGPDDDDTFPPAIAGYEVKSGWLFYRAKNGGEGVIVGSQKTLDAWAAQVDKLRGESGGREVVAEDWTPAHGGKQNVELAKKAASKAEHVLQVGGVKITFVVNPDAVQSGDHSAGHVTMFNPQRDWGSVDGTGKLSGISVPAFAHTAAHEVAHLLFTHRSSDGHKAMARLKEYTSKHGAITFYHGMSGNLEGLMDLAAFYVNAGPQLKAKAPDLYAIVEDWIS